MHIFPIMNFLESPKQMIYFFYDDSLQSGNFSEDMIPTVGFNMRKVTKGNVTIKVWDIGNKFYFDKLQSDGYN